MGCCLGGYSLSGLFALRAAYQTDRFWGIAAVLPSVWFPGWESYMETHGVQASAVYLGLGAREEKTRNKTMAAVGGQHPPSTRAVPRHGYRKSVRFGMESGKSFC